VGSTASGCGWWLRGVLAGGALVVSFPVQASAEGTPAAPESALKHGFELGGHAYMERGASAAVLGGPDLGYRPLDFVYVGASFSDGGCIGPSCRALRTDVCATCTYGGVTEGSVVVDGVLPLSAFVPGLRHTVAPVLWLEVGLGLRNISMFDSRINRDASELSSIFSAQLGFSLSLARQVLVGVYGGVAVTDISTEIYGAEVFATSNGGAAFGTTGARLSWILPTVE
jgi:hypothetical protein